MPDFEAIIPERYRAKYDSLNDRWLILDMWHPQIKNLPSLIESIPENSPALKIVTGTEMNAIIGEMSNNGFLDKIIESRVGSGIINKDVTAIEERFMNMLARVEERLSMLDRIGGKGPLIKKKREKTPILNG